MICKSHCACTVYGKSFEGKNFRGFRGFLAIRECFPAICFCVNGGSYGRMDKTRSFSSERRFCPVTAKVFPLKSFAVYGSYNYYEIQKLDLYVTRADPGTFGGGSPHITVKCKINYSRVCDCSIRKY